MPRLIARKLHNVPRNVLRHARLEVRGPALGLGSRIAKRFAKVGMDTDFPELHGDARRASFV